MIVNFHPKEIPSKIGLELIDKLNAKGEHSVVHALDKTTAEWQAVISGSEKLIFVAPVFWWAAGYEFEKWMQSVLSFGFAYKYSDAGLPEGMLNGRAFEMHLTHGTPTVYAGVMQENIKTRLAQGIFAFCNATVDVQFHDLHV